METLTLKIIVLFVLSFTCLFFGLIPLRLLRYVTGNDNSRGFQARAKRCMSLLSCFGGGVFLATCLLDLLPTVRDKMSLVFDQLQINTAYPIAEFVIACGFFVVLIVEQTALDCKEKSSSHKRTRELRDRGQDDTGDREALLRAEDGHVQYGGLESSQYGTVHCEYDLNHHHVVRSNNVHPAEEHDGHSHDIHAHSPLRSLLLLLALSLHSVFEGIAIGLQTDNDQLLAIFSAVIIHKNILAFSLGMTLVQSNLSRCSITVSCLCFAVMAPIGIILGIVLIESFSNFTHSIANGILQGFATGTFLYITFLEVLPHEMNSSKDRLLKVLFLLLGFSTIAGLLFLDPTVIRPTCYQGAQPV